MKLEEMERILGEATPGPWYLCPFREEGEDYASITNTPVTEAWQATSDQSVAPVYYDYECAALRLKDAEFITMAREMLPKLLQVARAAKACSGECEFPEDTCGIKEKTYPCCHLRSALTELEEA